MTRILIVDDLAENRYLLVSLFSGKGYAVDAAANGAEALALAQGSPPDLVITDIMMPVMDGFELCRRWKRDEVLRRVPFVVYTATYTDPKDERLILGLGADRFLVKPQQPEALLEVVREVLAEAARDSASVRPDPTVDDDRSLLSQHNEALMRKLQEKVLELEADAAARGRVEREYQTLFNEMLDGFALHEIVCDAAGAPTDYRFLAVNPAFERMTGLKREDIVGRTVLEVLPDTERRWIERYGEVALTGEPAHFESHAAALGKHFEVTAFRPATGQFVCMFQDVTERKLAEEALAANDALLRIASETARFGGWSVDLRTGTCTWSDAVADIHGAPRGYSPPVADGIGFYAPEWRDRIDHAFAACATRGTPYDEEMEITTTSGERRWVRTIGEAVRDERGEIRRIQGSFQDITAHKGSEVALRAERDRFQTYLDVAGVMFVALDPRGTVTLVNRKGCEILGLPEREILGRNWFDGFIPKSEAEKVKRVFDRIVAGDVAPAEFHENAVVAAGGRERLIAWHNSILRDDRGSFLGIVSSGEDVTDRRRAERERRDLEAQLLQAQKMESIGRLAGGVAHDFNNLLAVIINRADFAAATLREGDPALEDVREIRKAGERASVLTRQLLAFSRKQVLETRVIDLGRVVAGMEGMLGRLLGEDIDIDIREGPGLGRVLADPGQIEQVIMNLAVNARDAMPNGGRLTIETVNTDLSEGSAEEHIAMPPVRYVAMSFSDTGEGMDEETCRRVFEPFFTTKERGEGTGLGLSIVYGIVKQSGGDIRVHSEPGRGTTFRIHLPQTDAPLSVTASRPTPTAGLGTETVLIVEDELAVRRIVERILRRAGYDTLVAADAGEAVLLCEQHPRDVHLLLTDVVMPGMGGLQLAERLAAIRPRMKVLYMSGYADSAVVRQGVLEHGMHFIGKPFSSAELTRKVRQVLDGR